MPNPFDQFDATAAPASGANPFDQFDSGAPPQQRSVMDKLLGRGGERYQLWPERLARSIGSNIVESGQTLGKVAHGELSATDPKAAGAALDIGMMASPMAPMRSGIMTAAKAAPKLEAPTREALKEASDTAYKTLDRMDMELQPHVVSRLADEITEKITGRTAAGERVETGLRINPRRAPETFGAIQSLREPPGRTFTFADVEDIRSELGQIANDKRGTTEALAAGKAREAIDEYLSNVPEFANLAKQARGNYAAMKRSDLLTKAEERAELGTATTGSGANIVNQMRQRAKAILLKPADRAKFNAEEQAALDAIARGRSAANIARVISRLGPNHPLSGWLTALASGHGLSTLGLGSVADWLSTRLTRGAWTRLEEATRARSPLAGPAPNVPPPRVTRPPLPSGLTQYGTGVAVAQPDALAPSDDVLSR